MQLTSFIVRADNVGVNRDAKAVVALTEIGAPVKESVANYLHELSSRNLRIVHRTRGSFPSENHICPLHNF